MMIGHLPIPFIAFMVGVILYLALLRAIRARLLLLSKNSSASNRLLQATSERGKVESWDLMSRVIFKGEHKTIGDRRLNLFVSATRLVMIVNVALILFLIYKRPGG